MISSLSRSFKRSLLTVLLTVVICSVFGNARPQMWRPQGRFGKRQDLKIKSWTYHSAPSPIQDSRPTHQLSYPPPIPPISFVINNVLCLRIGNRGHYKCVRRKTNFPEMPLTTLEN